MFTAWDFQWLSEPFTYKWPSERSVEIPFCEFSFFSSTILTFFTRYFIPFNEEVKRIVFFP
ncbi:hypothetical protein BOQ60_06035 [Chryseobacterium sp. CH1]|nr:hypothetical protein BOQ60_06035 [Chryseobacterium sp. CH1]